MQDGQLNGVLSNNRAIDWVHLVVNVGITTAVAGDFNNDGTVNIADYAVWRDTLGSLSDLRADANGNDMVDAADYAIWKSNYGSTPNASQSVAAIVPEPASSVIALSAGLVYFLRARCKLS